MPELPEVETIKNTLKPLLRDMTIDQVIVTLPRIIQKPDDTVQFSLLLQGHTIRDVERRGKFLRFILDGLVLVSHLRMEGRYGLYQAGDPTEPHTHVVFRFTDGQELRYRDVRQFGTMHLFTAGQEWFAPPLNKLGVEPLLPDFTALSLHERLQRRGTKIKVFLLNQSYVAGLGNIYVDEALFRAAIHPERIAGTLTTEEIERLHDAIVTTLREAVTAGGSSIKSYVNGQGEMGMFQQQLNIYGRKDEACVRCGQTVRKIVVGGRGTHFCPSCQPF